MPEKETEKPSMEDFELLAKLILLPIIGGGLIYIGVKLMQIGNVLMNINY